MLALSEEPPIAEPAVGNGCVPSQAASPVQPKPSDVSFVKVAH